MTGIVRTLVCMSLAFLVIAGPAGGVSAQSTPTPNPALIVLIGGMDSDPTPEQIAGTANRGGNSGLYRLRSDLQQPGVVTEYFNWNGTRAGKLKASVEPSVLAITDVIHSHVRRFPSSRVILVGNSWGGHTTWEVCQSLVDSPAPVAISYVVFLDPSSAGRANTARPKELPINIHRATNVYTRNLFGWRKWPREDRIENIDLGDPKQGYLTKNGPAYDATFDFSAHVAAEWDEKIHAAIKLKILDLVAVQSPNPVPVVDGAATTTIRKKPSQIRPESE